MARKGLAGDEEQCTDRTLDLLPGAPAGGSAGF